jgi:hypothetical protein
VTTKAQAPPEPEAPESEEGNEPLLDLETLAPKRLTIKIDGERYEIATMNDLGVQEQARRDREGTEFRELFEKKKPSKADGERLKELLDRLFDEVCLAPEEVKARLSDYQRQQVVVTFTAAPLMARMRKEEAEEKAKEEEESQTTEN